MGHSMKHNFSVGQNVLWHCVDYESNVYIKAVITEVHSNHCIAVSQNNDFSNYNNMSLWIDEDNEMDFFNADMLTDL